MQSEVEENGFDSTIAAQAVEQFPGIFRQTYNKQTEKRPDDGENVLNK